MDGRGARHEGRTGFQGTNSISPYSGTYQDQYGYPWPLREHHQHQYHHQPQQDYHHYNHHMQQQQQRRQPLPPPPRPLPPPQQQQQQIPPALHTTGGRPWTMYRMETPLTKNLGRCQSPAAPIMSRGTAVAREVALKGGGGGGGGGAGGGEGGGGEGGLMHRTQLTVVSYNVLADSLISFDYIPYCKTWNQAAWRARPGRVLQKVLEFRPTVVCLQEVDEDQYQELFKQQLESLGYVGAYCQRTGRKSDGCATFLQGQHVRLVEQENVLYKVQGHPVLNRDNVALLVVVDVLLGSPSAPTNGAPANTTRVATPHGAGAAPAAGAGAEFTPAPVSGSSSRKDAGAAARLVIANTHLVFNPKRGDVKTAQLMLLTDKVERLSKSSGADGVLICGDFNMTPDSALYQYMVGGALVVDGLNRFTVSGQWGQNNGQRKETDSSGTLSYRAPGAKHQGSGCSLGAFPQPVGLSPGGRGGSVRGRGGRGKYNHQHRRQDNNPQLQPLRSSCEACSNRLPHDASSAYVIADGAALAASTDYRSPPGARPGALFAVMDPGPCPCATARLVGAGAGGDGSDPNVRMSHVVGKRKAEGAAGDGGEEEPQIGREPYNPPVLWPVNGEKFAFQRDRGPVAHGLRLESAYAQQADAWGTGEPAFSSYHHMFKGTVDYIFFGPGASSQEDPRTGSRPEGSGKSGDGNRVLPDGESPPLPGGGKLGGCLRCVGVAELPLRLDLDRFGGLPSPEEPSDHLLLAARFEIVV